MDQWMLSFGAGKAKDDAVVLFMSSKIQIRVSSRQPSAHLLSSIPGTARNYAWRWTLIHSEAAQISSHRNRRLALLIMVVMLAKSRAPKIPGVGKRAAGKPTIRMCPARGEGQCRFRMRSNLLRHQAL